MDYIQAKPGVSVTIGPAFDPRTNARTRHDEDTGKRGTIAHRAPDGDVFVDLDGGGGIWVSHGRLMVTA